MTSEEREGRDSEPVNFDAKAVRDAGVMTSEEISGSNDEFMIFSEVGGRYAEVMTFDESGLIEFGFFISDEGL